MTNTPLLALSLARRWTLLGLAIFMAYLLTVAVIHVEGRHAAERGETPLLTDFTSLYAASLLVRNQAAADLYRPREMYRASLSAAQAAYDGKLTEKQARAIGFHPWMYPPTFILLALPLAYLPYFVAWAAWLALTSIPYLLAMRMILKDQSFWLIAMAAPPVFFNIMYGQTGFLIAGLIALGLAWLQKRPVLAGICIGLASVKPHFGILIPLALICGGYWKTFAAATLTVIGTVLLSLLLLGADPWYGFIGTAVFNLQGFEHDAYKWGAMTTVLSALHQTGLGMAIAWKGQLAAALVAALIVCRCWWWSPARPVQPGLEAAILCSATLLAVPMAYLYDLMLLVPALAWLWQDMQERGYRPWELLGLVAVSASLLGLRETAGEAGNFAGVLPTVLLLAFSLRRLSLVRQQPAVVTAK
jgi:hypothetical protein